MISQGGEILPGALFLELVSKSWPLIANFLKIKGGRALSLVRASAMPLCSRARTLSSRLAACVMFPFGPPLVQQWDGGRTVNPFVDRTRRLQGIVLEQKVDIQSCVENPGDACNGAGVEAGSGFPNSYTTGMQFDRWHSNGLPDPN